MILVAVFEAFFLLKKFPVYTSAPHVGPPIELATVGPFRIGAVYPHHGAVFVRLSRFQKVVPGWEMDRDGEVATAMRRELRRVPLKAAAEFLVYSLLAVCTAAAIQALSRRAGRVFALAAGVAMVAGLVVLCLESSLALGYGTSMWSTWAGPGAFSFSYSQQGITTVSGETVAHRFVLEALNLGATRVLDSFARPLTYIDVWIEPPQTWAVLAGRTAGMYAALAFLVTAGASVLGRFVRRQAVSTAA